MKNFDLFYNETYKTFYNACKQNPLLSPTPLAYIVDNSLDAKGEYNNNTVKIKSNDISTKAKEISLGSTLYHEFTHYYDEQIINSYNYTQEQTKTLMLTYSERHASYNEMLYLLGFHSLKINKLFNSSDKITPHVTFAQFCAAYSTNIPSTEINILTLKRYMYFLGERKAFLHTSKNKLAISKIYNFDKIYETVRPYIISIENILNTISLDNIDNSTFTQLDINKLEIERRLMYKSIKDIPFPEGIKGIKGIEEIKHIIDNLPNF